MHSYIYQIGTKPFNDEQALNPDTIEGGDRVFFDYAYNISAEERTYAIRGLVETILPKGMFSLDPDNNLIYNGGFKIWRKSYYDKVISSTTLLTPANIMGGRELFELNKALNNPLDTVRLFECDDTMTAEQSIVLMRTVEELKQGDILYIGSVLGFHC